MSLRRFLSRDRITSLSKLTPFISSSRNVTTSATSTLMRRQFDSSSAFAETPTFKKSLCRCIHTAQQANIHESGSKPESENDEMMNEFLSRFVWNMRKKLREAYPDCDKPTIDGMLVIIVESVVLELEKGGLEQLIRPAAAPSADFSEDLWRTVWEVSNVVLQDMAKEKKKEKMKVFLQCEEVKEMYRFAGEVGVRGDMLRELRFKWARQILEKSEFYENLERLCKVEEQAKSKQDAGSKTEDGVKEDGVKEDGNGADEDKPVTALPKRHGKLKYKIYGLNLSDPKWAEVADKISKSDDILSTKEPKPISTKCKLVTEKIILLQENDDPAPLLGEWIDLLEPNKIDWIALLDKLKEKNSQAYFKIAEILLDEESFQAEIHDYSKLMKAYEKDNRLQDAERLLQKMEEKGIAPDAITLTTVIYMYCKSQNTNQAKKAFDILKSRGFKPEMELHNAMIMAYVNAGDPKLGEALLTEIEISDNGRPPLNVYMALLRSFAQVGDAQAALRIFNTMEFAGFETTIESCSIVIEAYARENNPSQAKTIFDYLRQRGLKPDDRCVASMIAVYEKNNQLDKALNLLLELEKEGFAPGVATYTNLVDWLVQLGLNNEAEHMLGKIAELREAPPFQLQIVLCDMYAKAGLEKKALQALGVVEANIEQLKVNDFVRIVSSLRRAGFVEDAKRMQELMEVRGFVVPRELQMSSMTTQALSKGNLSHQPRYKRDMATNSPSSSSKW